MLISSTKPFSHSDRKETKKKILCADYDFSGDGWIDKTEEGKDFVSKLLVVDARKRLTAKEAYRHMWCQDNAIESEREVRSESYTTRLTDEEFIELCKKNFEQYAGSCELKRFALNRLAHTCTSEDIRSLHEQFKKFDHDGNGVILRSEFVDTMKNLGFIDEESLEELFCKLDVFSDGMIRYTEFIAGILEFKGDIADDKIVEVFNQFDVDRSGYITKENLRHVMGAEWSQEKIENMIDSVDVNHDGKISFDEFQSIFKSQFESELGEFQLEEEGILSQCEIFTDE